MSLENTEPNANGIALICDCGTELWRNTDGRFACGCGTSYAVTVTKITRSHT